MVYTLDEIRKIITPIAVRYKLKAVYVFGSYARGEAREDSDVDLLVDCTGSGMVGLAYGGLYSDLAEALGKSINMVTIQSLEQPAFSESDIKFREAVRQERREVYAVA